MTTAKSYCLFAVTTALLLFYQAANCQLLFAKNHKRYVIKTVNVEDGLLNNSVNDIVTDTFGFTWIATKTGLQRYNGYRLETVHPAVNGKPINISYQVHFLKTKDGLLWVTCHNGILLYNPYLDQFSSLIQLPQTSSVCPLQPLEETGKGVWCLNENGFALYDHNGRLIRQKILADASLISSFVNPKFSFTSNTKFIFLTTQNGILQFNKSKSTYTVLHLEKESINSLACNESKLYIAHNNGIAVVDINDKNKPAIKEAFFRDKFYFGTIKVFGDKVMASASQHLLLLDSNCNNVSEISTLESKPVLPAGYIAHLYEDQFKRLWLLTNDDIKVIQNYAIPFQYYAYPNATNFVKCICVDESNNRVLAGCFTGGIQLYDTLNNPLWKNPLLIPKAKDVVCIEKLSNNTYFVETLGQGWYILFLHEKRLQPLPISDEEEAQLHTHNTAFPNNIQRLDSTNIIITTTTDVIKCCFKRDQIASYQILFHNNNNNHLINCFYLNQTDGRLWIGTNSGTLYCKHSNSNIDTLNVSDNYMIRSFACDAQNNLWVGTDKGLFVYANNKLIKTFTTGNGLLNDCIYSMLTDDRKKTIYASSNLGLSALQLNGVLKNYTKEKGLQENEFNTSAIDRTSKGKLFFGGVNGITAFYPSDVITEPDRPSLIIYKTEINDQPFVLDSAAWNAHAYSLSYNQNKVDFSLTAFGLQASSSYLYEYKMQGFDKYWTSTSQPTSISYHLPPGTYQFEARVMQFPSTFITRNIVIAAPFWQRWWFYFACVVFVFATLLLTARAIYRRRYVARLQALRIRQQVLAERERISRDLHDNIGAYASAISASVDDVIYQFNASDHIAMKRLKESAREIIVQLRDSIWALNKEAQTVIMLSDRIKNYVQKLQPTFPHIGFDVDENIEQNQTIASITALHVLRIVQEAVHNAIKHSGCTSIQINISSQSPVIISIKDDGCGMPVQPQLGEGLKNMQARAADIDWKLTIVNDSDGCCVQLRNTN